jgi:predicted SAM-dependent methyltransferase
MFFPEKITKISEKDRVLEIGPGSNPYSRSDEFLELKYESENTYCQQRGSKTPLITDKRITYYDGNQFPYEDNSFDYIICSHVLEHVINVEYFIKEMFRVGNKGYIEYPSVYYEYLYNFSVHVNILKQKNKDLFFIRKQNTNLDSFSQIHMFFRSSLEKGYDSLINDLKNYMFEGFEWEDQFNLVETMELNELISGNLSLKQKRDFPKVKLGPFEFCYQKNEKTVSHN